MAKRKIIKIDEDKCNGCGLCIPNCKEGALKVIDGKVRLISDLFCDGLGACIGHCPQDAITIIEREAEEYDEEKVMAHVIKGGNNVIKEHIEHLKEHGQDEYVEQAMNFLKKKNIEVPEELRSTPHSHGFSGCPGSAMKEFNNNDDNKVEGLKQRSQLRQWPVQLHLVSPMAPYFKGKDVVLAADCVAYSLGNFHSDYLKGKSLAIACPKLDEGQEVYIEKMTSLIDDAKINTLTVMIMEVPCCGGLLHIAQEGAKAAKRKIPVKLIVVGLEGDIQSEEWAG